EKFFRAHDPSLHSTGTTKFMGAGPGLGLTIARGVIEGHGGRIWVESPGHDPEHMPGSTFYITLPLNPPSEARRILPFETGSAGTKGWEEVFDTVMKSAPSDTDPSPTIPRPFIGLGS
ncbi:MAG: hypothetical protein JW910_04465, partial [Anaerolineae bacterium]|nr:hypothetical protein [Anaerolineae bacterium]